jgi:hypothetical protein
MRHGSCVRMNIKAPVESTNPKFSVSLWPPVLKWGLSIAKGVDNIDLDSLNKRYWRQELCCPANAKSL